MNRLYYLLVGGCLMLGLTLGSARAETVVWADNFETNAAAHWTTGSSWTIGSPTAGPALNAAGYRTHSGAVCASTQKYGYDQDSRLICTSYHGASSLLVPASDQYPRLRFWQWFNYANALGYVEVSTDASRTWTRLSTSYLDVNGGGVWSRPYFDLSAFSGQNIQIAFHFTSGGCCGNALGWFVDDVEVVTGVPLMTFPEGFEFDPKTTDWSVDAGTWEIGRPTSGPGKTHSGTNCAATVLAGKYLNNVDSRLISPPFTVPPSNSPTLRFWHWYSLNNALGYVEINNGGISTVSFTNYTIVTNTTTALDTNVYQLYGAFNTNYSTPLYWNSTIRGWTNATSAMGSVFDYSPQYYSNLFAAGPAPLTNVGTVNPFGISTVDYRATNDVSSGSPLNPGSTASGFLGLQGATWFSATDLADNPVGYFGTNYTYTYTTNASVISYNENWTQISPTYEDSASSGWTNVSLDLSSYEGQTVRIAFHFTSGGVYSAPGWYVDDLSLGVPPELIVPTNQLIYAGDELNVTNYVANSYDLNATYTFALLSPPAGVAIDSQGILTWQTTAAELSSTNTITVVATDDSSPPLSATNSFTVTVINQWVPSVIVPAPQTIYAGQTMSVTVGATNEFYPNDTFTFALLSPVLTNMDISDLAFNGVLSWPTGIRQPAGAYTNVIEAMDDDSPYFSATNSFVVTVLSPLAPVVNVPATQTIYAGQTLEVSITAANSAYPGSTYQFALSTNSPAGANIVSDGPVACKLSWMTATTNKIETVSFTVLVTDNHTPPLSGSGRFSVNVLPTPHPTLVVPAAVTNYSGQQVSVSLSATNAEEPEATYVFSLLSGFTDAFITNVTTASAVYTWTNTGVRNGVFVWTNDSVAPGTNTIYVRVQDNSSWANSVTNHFSLVFLPPQRPYLLDSATNGAVYVGERTTNLLIATNWMVPAATYSYVLLSPLTNGLIQTNELAWTNVLARPGIYPLRLKLTDNSAPPLVNTNFFFMTVFPLPSQLAVANPSLPAGAASQFRFAITTPWTNLSWRIEAATNVAADDADWLSVYTNQGSGGSLIFTDRFTTNFPQRYYRAVFP